MNVLYIETSTHLKRDLEYTWYTNDYERVKIWEKYISKYGDLTLIAPYEKEICGKGAKGLTKLGNIHRLKDIHITLEEIDDLYRSKFSVLNKEMRKEIRNVIWRNVRFDGFDLVVIGKDKNFYQKQALKYAKTYNKKTNILN